MDNGNRLVVIVAGVFVLTFLPIIIVIALILGSIAGLDDEADPCAQVAGEDVLVWRYPVPSGNAEVVRGYDAGDDPENPRHGGLDFNTTDVLAAAEGEVISTDNETVVIRHRDGMQSVYKYLESIEVGRGEVASGRKLGTAKIWAEGLAASATRHLHFEITIANDGEQMPLDAKQLIDDSAPAPGCGCGGTGEFYSKIPEPWRQLISTTAAQYPDVDARLVAATLWAENRGWPRYRTTGWAVSSAAAQGPWQFIPSTWEIMKHDGNGDGRMDPNDPADEVHAAFKHQLGSAGMPILPGATGNAEADFNNVRFHRTPRDNLMAYMANYNGSGAPEDQVLASFPLGDQNSDYVRMGYWLIASDFTRGWLPESNQFVDATQQGEGAGGSGGDASANTEGESAPVCGGSNPVVNIDGHDYSFPVVLPKNDVTNNSLEWPCPYPCHHDGSPAYDLFRPAMDDSSAGVPVVAVTSGEIRNYNTSYRGQEGCVSFQLVGDDGWWYWYGHVQEQGFELQDGVQVTAGQQIAIIGERRCTGNGSLPHLHIDRGSPKGSSGGNDCCRDPGFVELVNRLYESLGT